jgi:hypothetical protein
MTETHAADYDYAAAKKRVDAIQGLRDLADFLEQHPGVPAPTYNTLNVGGESREDLARIARLCPWQKDFGGEYFSLRKIFKGPLTLDVYVSRDQVCRKIVTGTRIVPAVEAQPEREEEVTEWVCEDALLAVK